MPPQTPNGTPTFVSSAPTPFKPSHPSAPTDSHIDSQAALRYWSSIPPTNAGVLGGYPQVSRVDLQGSANFLTKLKRKSFYYKNAQRLPRAVDCGAGIGRVTLGFLAKVADVVDIVEPVEQLTRIVTEGEEFADLRERRRVGDVWNVGLEVWVPPDGRKYDLIWNQWCLGQLTDRQLEEYLGKSKKWVKKGGWIVVKENMSTEPGGEDVFDEVDSSVTRADEKFRDIFKKVGLRIVASELQKGMPKEIYPVRCYALQPEVWEEDGAEGEEE